MSDNTKRNYGTLVDAGITQLWTNLTLKILSSECWSFVASEDWFSSRDLRRGRPTHSRNVLNFLDFLGERFMFSIGARKGVAVRRAEVSAGGIGHLAHVLFISGHFNERLESAQTRAFLMEFASGVGMLRAIVILGGKRETVRVGRFYSISRARGSCDYMRSLWGYSLLFPSAAKVPQGFKLKPQLLIEIES